MSESKKSERKLTGTRQADGSNHYQTALTPTSHDEPVRLLYGKKRVIPVIFIPGILGTRLKSTKNGKPAWNPPNTVCEQILTFWNSLWMSTEDRAAALDPDNTEVNNSMPNLSWHKNYQQNEEKWRRRCWGTVYADAYLDFLVRLETDLNPIELYDKESEHFKMFATSPSAYGAVKKTDQNACSVKSKPHYSAANSTEDALQYSEYEKVFKHYSFEVWACGYNWLKSNIESAEYVHDRITKICASYDDNIINKDKKILIVSHSMGGLVTRRILLDYPELKKQILGVVHIAQPASGSGAAYWRMRAGFEDGFAVRTILGRNAADVTSILGRAQSGLELLPFPNYKKGDPWLFFPENINTPNSNLVSLPFNNEGNKKKINLYKSIYKSGEWYGLIPDYNLKYIMAGSKEEKTAAQIENDLKICRFEFSKRIDLVQKFHKEITNEYHQQTYAIWGDAPDVKTAGNINWEHSYSEDDPDSKLYDNGRRWVRHGAGNAVMAMPDDPGDGTVPAISAETQKEHVQISFIQGNKLDTKQGKKNQEHGWAHATCCSKDDRVQWSALYSIMKLVQQLKPKGK